MPRPAERAPRFTSAERMVHRATGGIVAVLVATGMALYYEPLVLLVSRRTLVETVHSVAGICVGLPMLVGLLVSPELRADVRRLSRMLPVDAEWLRRRDRRRAGLPVGKFNGGQKVAAAVFAGAGLVLFGTGLLLLAPLWFDLPDSVREGATVTHDLFTFALLLLLAGHIYMAVRHPVAAEDAA